MSTLEQKQLLDLVAYALFGGEKKNISMTSVVLKEAKQQAVLTLIEWDLTISTIFYVLHAQYLDKNLKVDDEHAHLHTLLTEAEIPYVAIKGSVSASYYPEPILRTMGDVDLLVAPSDLSRVEEVLLRDGFCLNGKNESSGHCSYDKQMGSMKITCEVHWQLPGVPQGKIGERICAYSADIVTGASLQTIPGGECMFPSDFHHGLVMLLHIAEHLLSTGVGLRHLCDWAVFVAKFSDAAFCELFEEKLKAVGLWSFACLLTQLSIRYLKCPKRTWCGVGEKAYLEKVMTDIMDAGNFGKKDKNRIYQANLITDAGEEDMSLLKQFVLTMNKKARREFPFMKKAPILLPVGWAYVGVRHLAQVVTKKRPRIRVKNMIDGATERKEIYKEFQLFEVE